MWSYVYLERTLKDAEEEKEREREIREEEMVLAGWTSFIPLRESGLWGMAEGISWNVDQDTSNETTTTATLLTSPRTVSSRPVQPPSPRPDFADLNLDFEDINNPARSMDLDHLPTNVWGTIQRKFAVIYIAFVILMNIVVERSSASGYHNNLPPPTFTTSQVRERLLAVNEERARVRREAQEAEVEEQTVRTRLDVIHSARFRRGREERSLDRTISDLNSLLIIAGSVRSSGTHS